MTRTLIVTADDFGLDIAVNEAVEEAHREGILTCASLMVGAPAAADAVARARRLPKLGVGLHVTLVDGAPTLPKEQVSLLTGGDGRFRDDPVRQGIAIFCRPAARRQARAEIAAQLAAFRATGLPLDHLNSHHHFHLHPVLRQALLEIAAREGVALRLPYEAQPAGRRTLEGWSAWWQAQRLGRGLRRRGIPHNAVIFGLAESGHVDTAVIRRAIAAAPEGVSELYLHPAARPWRPGDPWARDYDGMGELRALADPKTVAAVAEAGIRLATFAGAFAETDPRK